MTVKDQKVTQEDASEAESYSAPFALKFLVGALAVAIVVMLLLIIMKIMNGDHKKDPEVVAVETAVPVKAVNLKDLKVQRPEGSDLVSASVIEGGTILMHFRSADKDILVRVSPAGEEQRIVVE